MLEHLLPSRRQLPGDDPIFMANAEATRRRSQGEDVLNVTVGALMADDGKLVVLDAVMEAWRQLTPMEVAPYAPIAGDPAFLTALAQRHWPSLPSHGVGAATPGGSGALMLSLRNLLEPGMTLLTAAPFWGPYATLALENRVGLATAPFPEAGQALDADAWERAAGDVLRTQGRLLVWLNDPCHNPTGHSLTQEDRTSLLAVLDRLSGQGPVTLLLDFAYLDYTRDPAHVREALDHYQAFARSSRVLVGASLSLSKALTLYGGRGGALVFPFAEAPELQAALTMSCRGTYSNCNKASQATFLRLTTDARLRAALDVEHAHWRSVLTERAAALDSALKAEGFPGAPWRGGYFITLRHPEPQALNTRLKARGIFVVPLPEGIRIGICGLRVSDAPRFAAALRASWA